MGQIQQAQSFLYPLKSALPCEPSEKNEKENKRVSEVKMDHVLFAAAAAVSFIFVVAAASFAFPPLIAAPFIFAATAVFFVGFVWGNSAIDKMKESSDFNEDLLKELVNDSISSTGSGLDNKLTGFDKQPESDFKNQQFADLCAAYLKALKQNEAV